MPSAFEYMSQGRPAESHENFELPSNCRRILIVGAGGFGREVLQWARHAWPEHVSKIAGFLSSDSDKLEGHAATLPILGSPADYQPQPSDGLVLAIGIPRIRREVAEQLEAKGSRFLTLIHPAAIVADTAKIGTGTVICPCVVISVGAHLGRFALLNYHASIGHDAHVGDFAVLSPYATLGGGARVLEDVFLGLHASVGPSVTVGQRGKVSSNSCALASAPADSIIYGVPGRIARCIAIDAGCR